MSAKVLEVAFVSHVLIVQWVFGYSIELTVISMRRLGGLILNGCSRSLYAHNLSSMVTLICNFNTLSG
ncbi:MAG: hypothetical protein ACPHQD_07355 [Vibrio toranzoniae]|uniref:hypothetical protein n=1 Tax=Vibrio toranzoniae TaxID=1194427 RepID=UPI0007F3769B|nr:hypothetical protein [Vibrio toranzoniae]NAZ70218.1 hypothetical protein [Vibrio toranzoniae]NAZ95294.1 hypothetical protein [Vibrio toranzoniae]SBS28928.1 hypothetical protein VTO7225_00863 [Vibrio toranzoniae]